MASCVRVALAMAVCGLIGQPAPVAAQSEPVVRILPATPFPSTFPSNERPICLKDEIHPSPTCPTLKYNNFTYWPGSYLDNRMVLSLMAFDPLGYLVWKSDIVGYRYVQSFSVDRQRQTFSFVAQTGTGTLKWSEIFIPTPTLLFGNVSDSALNCVFAPDCNVAVTDSFALIPLPSGMAGTARLETRTFLGVTGAPGAGKTAYAYRIDLTQATVHQGEHACITELMLDAGPVSKLPYTGPGQIDTIFVVTQGGAGTIGLINVVQVGNQITMTFDQPVCAGRTPGSGQSSFFVGFAATGAPRNVSASVVLAGAEPIAVAARGPNH